ncbi:MAG: NAD(P)-binding protein, partial [Acidobacteriota bacterium]|nr:NAD(P)-binding protein [Acidobacteriota bacterium]
MKSYDAIIVGGGHNALVTAFYLARAGVRTLVLERRNGVGGAAVTEDLYPGFKCPALAHAVGPLHPKVVDDLALHHHGVRFTEPEVRLFAPLPDHRTLLLPTDPVRAADSISAFSQRDSKQYLAFSECLDEIGSVLRDFLWRTP